MVEVNSDFRTTLISFYSNPFPELPVNMLRGGKTSSFEGLVLRTKRMLFLKPLVQFLALSKGET